MGFLVVAEVRQGETGWDLLQFTTPAKELRTKPGDRVPQGSGYWERDPHTL